MCIAYRGTGRGAGADPVPAATQYALVTDLCPECAHGALATHRMRPTWPMNYAVIMRHSRGVVSRAWPVAVAWAAADAACACGKRSLGRDPSAAPFGLARALGHWVSRRWTRSWMHVYPAWQSQPGSTYGCITPAPHAWGPRHRRGAPQCAGALDQASPGDGRWTILWTPVQCPVGVGRTASPFFYSFQGSNPWYLKLQIANTRCARQS